MKKYPGQAIAIIMVVLVVAAVIGASLYSRMTRNKGEVVDTRESQMALEQAGNVLDVFTTADIPTLQNYLSDRLKIEDPIELTTVDEIEEFISVSQIGALDLGLLNLETGSCVEPKVTITYAGPSDGIEYGVGQVMAVHVGGTGVPVGCQANFYFSTAGTGDHLFSIKYVYRNALEEVSPYALEDMKLYCLNTGATPCSSSSVAPTSSVELPVLASGGSIPIDFTDRNLHQVYEVRVLPLKEKIKVSIQGNLACGHVFDNYLIRATSICTGQERTMEVVIPSAANIGYPALFDYTIYNSFGTLTPHND